MQAISEEKKTVNYEELIEIINSGYEPIGDLKQAMEYPLILKTCRELPIIIKYNYKVVDTYLYYIEKPYPCLSEYNGLSKAEEEIRQSKMELWGWKYQ